MHCWGAEHRRQILLRKLPLEVCSYRLCSNHFEENPPCVLTRGASRTRKLMKVAHDICKSIAIWLRWGLYKVPGIKKGFMLIPTQVSVDPYKSLHKCDVTWGVLSSLIHFAIIDASILYTDDLAFTLWVMFSQWPRGLGDVHWPQIWERKKKTANLKVACWNVRTMQDSEDRPQRRSALVARE